MFNFSMSKNSTIDSRPSVLRLASIGIGVFLMVFIFLNIHFLTNWFEYAKNHFTDADEEAETELLMAKYHSQGLTPIVYATKKYDQKIETINIDSSGIVSSQNFLYIPKLNIKTPIVTGSSSNIKQVLTDLQKGVLLYPNSALPGNGGSTVIIGHSSSNMPWNKYSHIFSLLNNLESGDLVYINYGNGYFVYRVNIKKTGSVFTLAGSDIKGDLILSSCWPIGTDNGRIVIAANLI